MENILLYYNAKYTQSKIFIQKNKSRYKGGANAKSDNATSDNATRKHKYNLNKENRALNEINATKKIREREEEIMMRQFLPPSPEQARPSPARPAPVQPQSFFQRIFSRPAWLKPEITNPIFEEAVEEAQSEAPAQADAGAEAQIHPTNNRFIPYNNMREIGRGASKLVMARRSNPNNVIIRPLPEALLTPSLKKLMEEDFMFSFELWNRCPKYFPKVSEAWETKHTFNYKKQRCVQITNSNITLDVLNGIILAVIDLIDTCRLFTFDLKPPNMGLFYGKIKFIDFGPDSSFLLKPDCDTTDYKSIVILILLVYCYNFCLGDPMLTREDLRAFAREFIHDIEYQKLFQADYIVEEDPCLDLSFNKRLAPSFETYLTPKQFLDVYSIPRGGAHSNFHEILAYFSS